MNLAETDVYARSMVWRMYRDAADEDYLMARSAIRQKLHYQFFWNAQQALEKYLKCSIILNGGKDEGFGHKLSPMWARMEFIAPELLPLVLCPPFYIPDEFRPHYRRFEPADKFIKRMEQAGDPNNRYRYYSITTDEYDLHKFDEVCFQLRRTCFPLNMPYAESEKTYRQMLTEDPSLQPHSFQFLKPSSKEEYKLREEALRWRNFSFYEDEAITQREITNSVGAVNGEFYLALKRGKKGLDALNWVTSKVYLSRLDARQISEKIAKIRRS